MASTVREAIDIEVDAALLTAMRDLARREHRDLQALVDEAFADLIAKHASDQARPHVLAAYRASLDPYDALYTKLAK